MATVATGTPGGICTVDSSASIPFSADESIGTPMTGRVVCAATTPARCAAAPAPTMNTLTPRAGASYTSCKTRAGDRCAEATVISHRMPNSASTSPAADMTAASQSDPIRISTSSGVDMNRLLSNVAAILHPVQRNQVNPAIRLSHGRIIRASLPDHRQSAAAQGYEPPVFTACAPVTAQHVGQRGGVVDAFDQAPRMTRRGIPG